MTLKLSPKEVVINSHFTMTLMVQPWPLLGITRRLMLSLERNRLLLRRKTGTSVNSQNFVFRSKRSNGNKKKLKTVSRLKLPL